MALGDSAGLKAVEKLNAETLPELKELARQIVEGLQAAIDRLDGATITITIKIPAREKPSV